MTAVITNMCYNKKGDKDMYVREVIKFLNGTIKCTIYDNGEIYNQISTLITYFHKAKEQLSFSRVEVNGVITSENVIEYLMQSSNFEQLSNKLVIDDGLIEIGRIDGFRIVKDINAFTDYALVGDLSSNNIASFCNIDITGL